MQVVILCGGRGTRLLERTEEIPKPLVEVGDKPILWHLMKTYAHFGLTHFILCLGYKGHQIIEHFRDQEAQQRHHSTLLPTDQPPFITLSGSPTPWHITFVDTGLETNTGGRIKRVEAYIQGDTFMVNYADGLADIDLHTLLRFHHSHRRLATITAVKPHSQFGIMHLNGSNQVVSFEEKPRLQNWVNGGFFVFQRGVFDYLAENSVLEQEPLEHLARDHQLMAYRHDGFWQCMDTYKDTLNLNSVWQSDQAKWKVWDD